MSTIIQSAYSIKQFCEAHDLSRSGFYNLLKAGLAPTIMKVGRRTLISSESANIWRKAMETNPQNSRREKQ